MFLYTTCPNCSTGYDLTDLMRGKKMRCKSCREPFSVTAAPRPRGLPPLAPFVRPQLPVQETATTAQPLPAFPEVAPAAKLDAITRPGARPRGRFPQPRPPSPISSVGSWFGRGGISAAVIVCFIVLRGCLALTTSRTPNYPNYYNPPPPVVVPPQQPWQPNNQPWQQPKIVIPKFEGDPWKGMKQPPIKPLFPKKGDINRPPPVGGDVEAPQVQRRDGNRQPPENSIPERWRRPD